MIDSGKLPTQMTVTDGVDTITVPIVDWQGYYDGATLDPQSINAIWVMPNGYTTRNESVNPVVVVRVNTPQTKVISSQKELVASLNATIEIITGTNGAAVDDQANTDVTSVMKILVTVEDHSKSEYSITTV